jgi:hypothetical protein
VAFAAPEARLRRDGPDDRSVLFTGRRTSLIAFGLGHCTARAHAAMHRRGASTADPGLARRRVEVGRDEQRERGDDGGELHRVPVRRDRSLQAALGDLAARGGQRVGARSRTPIAGR